MRDIEVKKERLYSEEMKRRESGTQSRDRTAEKAQEKCQGIRVKWETASHSIPGSLRRRCSCSYLHKLNNGFWQQTD
jgi:hypothetical protein